MPHIPQRRCVSCRICGDKKTFIRVVRVNESTVIIDTDYLSEGRGAYVCPTEKCIQLAMKKKAFSRSLKTTVSNDLYLKLLENSQGR